MKYLQEVPPRSTYKKYLQEVPTRSTYIMSEIAPEMTHGITNEVPTRSTYIC